MKRVLTRHPKKIKSRIRIGVNYYQITTFAAAIALALVMSLMAQAQDDQIATDMQDTNQLSNPASPTGTANGTTFSDSATKKKQKKESGVRSEMQKAQDAQTDLPRAEEAR